MRTSWAGHLPAVVGRRGPVAIAAVLALLLGSLAAHRPLLAVVLGFALLYASITLRRPLAPLVLVLPLLALAPQFWETFQSQSQSVDRTYKLAVFVVIVALLVARGARQSAIPEPILAVAAVVVFNFTLAATVEPGLTKTKALIAALALAVPWLAALCRIDGREVRRILVGLCLVAVASILFGIVLQAGGVTTVFSSKFQGVRRLQGAAIPPFLAMMGFSGVASAVLLYRAGRERLGAFLGLVNVIIVAATATRGALIGAIIIGAPLAYRFFFQRPSGLPAVGLRLLAAAVIGGILLGIYVPQIVARTTSSKSEAVDTSGRSAAWTYFLDQTKASKTFGLGVGSAPLIGARAPSSIKGDFRATHNEYLRLYVEGGFVGFGLVLAGIILFLKRTVRTIVSSVRTDIIFLLIGWAIFSFVDNTNAFQVSLPLGLMLSIAHTLGEDPGFGFTRGAAMRIGTSR